MRSLLSEAARAAGRVAAAWLALIVFAGVAIGFLAAAAFLALASRYGPEAACVALGVGFALLALVAYLVLRPHRRSARHVRRRHVDPGLAADVAGAEALIAAFLAGFRSTRR